MTRSNASSGEPPKAAGSVSGPMISMNSTTEPGQPCVTIKGKAPEDAERMCKKWIRCPSIVVVNWPNPFSRASCTRQS